MLSRPGTRIAGYSLAMVGMTLLITLGRSHVTQTAATAAGIVSLLVVMILFLAALKLALPPRYTTNPRFQRFDIALGLLTLASSVLVVTSLVLAVLATDGQSPAPIVFLAAALIAGLAAGGLNEMARRRFPEAWIPAANRAHGAASRAQAMTHGNLTIRPTRFTRGFIAAFFGSLIVVAIVGTFEGSTPAGGIVISVFSLAFTAFIFWISAGCSDENVWFAWQSVDRATLLSIELSSRPGLGVDYGGLRLFDSHGALVLTVPSLYFADDDIQRLIEALALPLRSTG
jgi:hypothetical protein